MLGVEINKTPKGRLKAIMRCAETGEVLHESPWFENLITTAGKQFFIDAWDGAAARVLSNAQGGLLIGDGTATPAVGDTNLSGSNKVRIALDSGFPSRSGTTVTYQFTVASGVGNFNHAEFGLTNASAVALADGVLITHLLAGPFNKTAATAITYIYQLIQG